MLFELTRTLRSALLRRTFLLQGAGALVLGLLLPVVLGTLLAPATELRAPNALLATFVIELTALGVLLAELPAAGDRLSAWTALRAWIVASLLCACALSGAALAPGHHESARTFAALWLLFVAQAACATALFAALRVILLGAIEPARQLTLLLVALAVTALFWSKPLIARMPKPGSERSRATLDWTALVINGSPPFAIAAVWYNESDAAQALRGSNPEAAAKAESARFALIHGKMTYNVWMGSYGVARYPYILPRRDEDGRSDLGLALKLLIPALPLLLIADLFSTLRARGTRA